MVFERSSEFWSEQTCRFPDFQIKLQNSRVSMFPSFRGSIYAMLIVRFTPVWIFLTNSLFKSLLMRRNPGWMSSVLTASSSSLQNELAASKVFVPFFMPDFPGQFLKFDGLFLESYETNKQSDHARPFHSSKLEGYT